MKRFVFGVAVGFAVLACAAGSAHVIEIDHPVMSPDEGLLLGNGDLSVSVYQTADDLVFRLGKGDVWDRRFNHSKQPAPPTIDEVIDGVLHCGWKVTGWNATNVEEMKKMPKGERLLEITQGKTALRSAPYPTPKPTGELRMRLPLDLGQPERVVQRLVIEEGLATFDFSWKGGAYTARFEAVVDPEENVVAVAWKMDGWQESTRLEGLPPIYAAVYRWADPDYETWLRKEVAQYPSYPGKPKEFNDGVTPLPPPQVVAPNQIEQAFPPDPLFPKGFRYRMTLTMPNGRCGNFSRPAMPPGERDAYFTLQGDKSTTRGAVALAVTTSRDKTLDAPAKRPFDEYKARAKKAGAAYWAVSGFAMPKDSFLENLWYSTYHARRCVLKRGAVPPGLFFPSALPDYSRWNGDYHMNYNFQSVFWGDFTANRLDQAENFMDGVEFSVPFARMMAKKYYNCRGAFFQLSCFPANATEDYQGSLPLGRMAYMTGWVMNHYWEYYQFTRDKAWLAKRGYPMMKDCALFYLDFLKKAPDPKLPPELKDGKYHLFPSVQGESGFKNPMDFCDKGQVVAHCYHALYAAAESAKILGVDADLQAQWMERLENMPRDDRFKSASPYERFCARYTSPDDGGGSPWKSAPAWDGKPGKARQHYLGITHWGKNGTARGNGCIPEREFATWRGDLKRWYHANGLVWGMAIRVWQRTGAWTESLACMSPIQELALQSWDGAIRLFPRWPASQDVSFRRWRAQGAFLVDADFANGRIGKVSVTSEKGEDCLVWGDWKVTDAAGRAVATDRDEFGRLRFRTAAGQAYALTETVPNAPMEGKARIERDIARMEARNAAAERAFPGETSILKYRNRVRTVNGTNVWTDAINAALKEAQAVRIPKSAEPYLVDDTLIVPSNRKILAEGATIRLMRPCDRVLLRNAGAADGTLKPVDRSKGDRNIFVLGGRWEDWQPSRAGYGRSGRFAGGVREKGKNFYGVSTLLYFGNVSTLTLRDVTIARAGGFAIQCGDAEDVVVENVVFDKCFADGFHCNGNVRNVLARNICGDVGDDLVALNFYDWQNSSVNFGPGDTVLCENLRLCSGYPAIRLLPAVYRYADGTKVDCALRNVLLRNVRGVNCFKMYLQTPSYQIGTEPEWGEVGSAENIWFEDIEIDLAFPTDRFGPYVKSDPLRGHFGAFEIGANVTGLHFLNVKADLHVKTYPLAHLVCVGPKSAVTGTKDGKLCEIFDPWVSCTAKGIFFHDLTYVGGAPAEPVHATVFKDINRDGRSTGRGTVKYR